MLVGITLGMKERAATKKTGTEKKQVSNNYSHLDEEDDEKTVEFSMLHTRAAAGGAATGGEGDEEKAGAGN